MAAAALLLALLACAAAVEGRPLASGARTLAARPPAAATGSYSRRALLGSAFCPDGCSEDGCVADSTTGGLRCNKCKNNLSVDQATGQCTCFVGKYASGIDTCSDCPRGSYCPGGLYSSADPLALVPAKLSCPGNMTTLGLRATSNRQCVNLPGFYYTVDAASGTVGALQCQANTFSAGLKKQRQCVPCPTGFTTNGVVGATSPNACVVPAGYYLKAPGQVAPCPRGEWKSGVGTNASCTKCSYGVTTPAEASTSPSQCSMLLVGFYAFTMRGTEIADARACPQKFYCPGGTPAGTFDPTSPGSLSGSEPSIKACPSGTWTQEAGSSVEQECLTPPGFKTAGGVTTQCAAGEWRAEWASAADAAECMSCGVGVFADKTDLVVEYDPVTYAGTNVAITSSPEDCYIKKGQGLYYSATTQQWRARNCDTGVGVANKTYGLTAYACRDCPDGMLVSRDAALYPNSAQWYANNGDGTGGFYSPMACVTKAGYGYDGRVAQPCNEGSYNNKDSYSTCTPCGFGLTTAGVGVGASFADCGIAQGYGYHNGSVVLCPLGTYNAATFTASKTAPCTACSTGTTTPNMGADSAAMCNRCMGGYGGLNCATQCGGTGASASYGTPLRPLHSPCTTCSAQTTGYSFEWMLANDVVKVESVSRVGADSAVECLAEFAQIADQAWYIPTVNDSGITAFSNVASFTACLAKCPANSDCQYVTYDYRTTTCYMRASAPIVMVGEPLIAFKAVPSGDVATNAWKKSPHAKALASGQYTFWQDPGALAVGTQTAAPGAAGFTSLAQCLAACDDDGQCAGVTVSMNVVEADRPSTCKLIKGNASIAKWKRTMTRVAIERLAVPVLL